MNVKGRQGYIKRLDKGALFFVEALIEYFLKLLDVCFLILVRTLKVSVL